jgi:ankyrin repeat protein
MIDPTMAPMYAMDDAVYMASQVRLGNDDGERPDFWLVLPAGVQSILLQYMDVKSLCRTDSIMTNVLAREAWYAALKGTESVALSKWPRYSSLDKFKGLRWSMNRRVALEGVKIWKVVSPFGDVRTDVGMQFSVLIEQQKFVDIAVMLVESKSIDVNMTITGGPFPISPLFIASQRGHLPVVQALLQGGAVVDKAMAHGATPLFLASGNGHVPVVQALLQAEADVSKAMDDGATPLFIASQEGHLPVVQTLLQAGADVDKAAGVGCTPLSIASQEGHVPVVQALLQAGADVDKDRDDGTTPVHIASDLGHLPVVQTLLQAGADVDKAADDGITPLIAAFHRGHVGIVCLLEGVTQ